MSGATREPVATAFDRCGAGYVQDLSGKVIMPVVFGLLTEKVSVGHACL